MARDDHMGVRQTSMESFAISLKPRMAIQPPATSASPSPNVCKHTTSKKRPAKKGKRRKDPDEPKRPPNNFLLFCMENRSSVKKAQPGSSFADITTTLSQMWGAMTEDDKQPYTQKQIHAKKIYEKEMKEFYTSKRTEITQKALKPPPLVRK